MTTEANDILAMTTEIVSAHVSHNMVAVSDLPDLIVRVHSTLAIVSANGGSAEPEEAPRPEPAVSIKKSVTPDFIICLEDGKKLKMLKRYIANRYGLTPDEYRARWGLPADYPMVAPNYAQQRSELAKQIGLGRKAA